MNKGPTHTDMASGVLLLVILMIAVAVGLTVMAGARYRPRLVFLYDGPELAIEWSDARKAWVVRPKAGKVVME